MTKLQSWLSGLLAVQLLLAGALLWRGYQANDGSEIEKLFDIAANEIDRIVISDGDSSVGLAKRSGQWTLPDNSELPATESKITSTLDSLADIELVWPVSTTTSSHERFEVEADNYQRDVKLFKGDDLIARLLIGTSPGFRKVHLRRAGEDEVYSVALNSFDFPATADNWLNTKLLNIADADQIKGPDFSMSKQEDQWQLNPDAAQGEGDAPQIEQDKANQLAIAFSNFSVQGLAESAPDAESVSFEVQAGDKKFVYAFMEKDDKYFVRRDDRDLVFTVSKYDYERMAKVNRESLVIVVDREENQESDESVEGADTVENEVVE